MCLNLECRFVLGCCTWNVLHMKSLNVPYSGFLSFVNCLKIDFRGENLCEFVVTQCTTPTNAVSNCLKIELFIALSCTLEVYRTSVS